MLKVLHQKSTFPKHALYPTEYYLVENINLSLTEPDNVFSFDEEQVPYNIRQIVDNFMLIKSTSYVMTFTLPMKYEVLYMPAIEDYFKAKKYQHIFDVIASVKKAGAVVEVNISFCVGK